MLLAPCYRAMIYTLINTNSESAASMSPHLCMLVTWRLYCRVVEVLRAGLSPEQQAQSGPQHLQAAAEAACTTLAEHLPLQDCAALAERILAVPAAAPSTLDLGLRLAGRFLGAPSIADSAALLISLCMVLPVDAYRACCPGKRDAVIWNT